MASFIHDDLDECVSLIVEYSIPPDVTWEPPSIDEAAETLMESEDGRESVRLSKPCAQQFADRTALATCTKMDEARPVEDAPEGVTRTAVLSAEGYRFETSLETDRRMRECLQAGGDWYAIGESSAEYRRAKLKAASRDVRRTRDLLQR